MKLICMILFFIQYLALASGAQEVPAATEQQMENIVDQDPAAAEDDSYWQEMEQFRKNPIDLNNVDESALKELKIISDLQIENFVSYRRLFGKLIDIHELQAVPWWDLLTIRRLLPFVTLSPAVPVKADLALRITRGEHSVLLRVAQALERSKGLDHSTGGAKYQGSPQKIFFRYRYAYKDLLQFGVVGDKDAGEQFFRGAQRNGFDFYSFHVVARKLGVVESLVIGDFTINMGQGLIQWQSLAFKKSSDVMGIKRQSYVLRPYSSAGEFYFHRGVGLTIKRHSLEATLFASLRKLNANLVVDTGTGRRFISSLLPSGNDRTAGEIADKNILQQIAFGGNIGFSGNLSRHQPGRWHLGINAVHYHFSLPLNRSDDAYNLYALTGDRWFNVSTDYGCTWSNAHFFGEAALDKNFHRAFINGLLISVDPRVDVSLVHRKIAPSYLAVYGNAFTENTAPSNEEGIYAGITIRPTDTWRLDGYADIYFFPWLKYLVNAPSYGKDFLIQLSYTPNKQTEVYIKYRDERKESNEADQLQESVVAISYPVPIPKRDLRVHLNYRVSTALTLRQRIESAWYNDKTSAKETGFLAFFDVLFKPPIKPYSVVVRWQYFETDGYNSRLYAYENDVLYSYSIPVFYGKGYGYYFSFNYDLSKRLSTWARWSQIIYRGQQTIGSGLDQVKGNKRTEIKLQARFTF